MAAPRRSHPATLASHAAPRVLKPVCLAVLGLAAWLAMPTAWALPDGGVPTHGQAQLQAGGNGTLTIRQTSAQAGFDWRSFSIAAGERVQVLQPDAQSILFNRVTGADPSIILGQLQANGRVFLSNPRGIIFGSSAQVDVGGLLATTLMMNQTAGADGRWQLGGGDAATGVLRMDGRIRAPGGTVALVGPQLSVGGNVLAGRLGLAAAAAAQVDVDGDGLIFFNLRDDNLAARLQLLPDAHLLARSAELRAAARSQFADTVLNLDGVVRAQGLVQQGGQVVIGGAAPQILVDGGASGVTRVAGTLDASATGTGETGGQVRVLGDRVWLDSTARLDARGDAGGGLVHVGGAWQGRGADRNALHTRVSAGAQIDASAIRLGPGGQVVVWADDSTVFNGAIRARGGLLGGDGGAVETSGQRRLGIVSGTVDAGAAPGFRAGLWLLDPQDITVSSAGTSTTSDGTEAWNDGPGTTLAITSAALKAPNASVVLQATGNITIASPVVLDAGEAFTAQAGGDVTVTGTGAVTTVDSAITLEANRVFNSQTPGGPAYGGTPSTASGSGKVVVQGVLDAGLGAISLAQTGGTGLHQLGGSFIGGSLTVTGAAQLASDVSVDVGSLALAGAVTLTAHSRVAVAAGRSVQIAGAIGDGAAPAQAFSLTKQGAGTLALAGTNAYRGGTVVEAGILQVAAGAGLGAAAGGITLQGGGTLAWTAGGVQTVTRALTLGTGGGTLDVAGTVTLSHAGALAGSGTLTKTGAGTLAMARDNTSQAADVTVSAGTLRLDTAHALAGRTVTLGTGVADGPVLSVAESGTIAALAGGAATAGDVQIAAGKTLTTGSASSTYSGKITGAAGTNLVKAGAGSFTLVGATGFAGATTVTGGALLVASDAALGAAAGTLTLDGGALGTTGAAPVTLSADRNISLGSGGGTLQATAAASLAVPGVVGGTGALRKAGDGTVTLGGANAYRGGTVVEAGSLQVSADSHLGEAAGGITLQDGGTLAWTAGGTQTMPRALTLGTGGGTLDVAGTVTLTHTGALAGTGALTKAGAGTLALAGNNTSQAANVTVDAGMLRLDSASALAGRTVTLGTVDAGAPMLSVAESSTIAALSGGTATAGIVQIAAGKTLTTGAVDSTYSGRISQTGATGTLAKAGDGMFTLDGDTGFTGATLVSGGVLRINGDAALGTAASTLTLNGGTLAITGAVPVTLAAGRSMTLGASGGTFDVAAAAPLAVAGPLSGAGALTKTGDGTLSLSGANTNYNGAVLLGAGTLALDHSQALGVGNLVSLDATTPSALTVNADTTLRAIAGGAAGTVSIAAGRTLTTGTADSSYSGSISGGVGSRLVKAGAGDFTLAAATGFTGATQVDGGTLTLGHAAALVGSVVTLGTDASAAPVLAVAVDGTVAALAGGTATAGVVQLAAGTTLTTGSVDSTFSGRVSLAGASGTLAKSGSGNFTLDGATGFTGATRLDGGTLTLAGASALAGSVVTLDPAATAVLAVTGSTTVAALAGGGAAGAVQLASGATLRTGAASSSFAGSITGAGALRQDGAGTFTLAGNNSHTGGTEVAAGTLQLALGAALPAGQDVSVSGGVLDLNSQSPSVGVLTLTGGQVLGGTLTATSYALQAGSISAHLQGGAGGLRKTGDGVATLSGTNAYTGSTTVSAGRLALSGTGALPAGGTLVVDGSGSLDLGGVVRQSGLFNLNTSGSVDNGGLDAGLFQLQAGSLNASLSGGATLLKQGSGSVVLNNANPDFAGSVTVSAGSLVLNVAGALHAGNRVSLDTATLDLRASNSVQALAGVAGGTVQVGSGSTLTNVSTVDTTFSGRITGQGSLVQQGGGRLTLAGSNDFGGTTTVEVGTLVLASGAALPDGGAVHLAGTGTLQLDASETIGALSGDGTVVLGTRTLTVDTATTSTFDGTIGGIGGLVKQGTGSLTLAGTNPFTGRTGVERGRLLLANGAALADGAELQVASGATLQLLDNATVGALSGAGTVALGNHTLTLGTAGSTVFSGGIGGANGGLVKQGSGSLTLAGSNSFGGGTVVLDGSLVLANDAALADTGSVVLAGGGARLQLGASETIGTLSGTGAVVLGAHTLTLNAGSDAVFQGNIGGQGGLVKAGAGTLTLTGTNTQQGGTTLTGGVLVADSDARLGAAQGALTLRGGSLRVADGHHLVLDAGRLLVLDAAGGAVDTPMLAQLTVPGAVSGRGTLTKQGLGTLVLQGDNRSHTGGLGLLAGSLRASGGQALTDTGTLDMAAGTSLAVDPGLAVGATEVLGLLSGAGAVSIASNTALRIGTAADASFSGSFSGGGTLVKQGAGALLLSGANSLLGGTQVLGGVLTIGDDASLGASGSLLTLDGGALRLAGPSLLQLPSSRSVLLGAGGGVFEVQSTGGQLDLLGTLSGTGSLRKQGAGSLHLLGAGLGFSGTVDVAAGTLRLANAAALPAGAHVTLSVDSLLRVDANTQLGRLAGTGQVALGGGAELALGGASDASFGGRFSGDGSLAKQGGGALTLAGASSHRGGTRVLQGRLVVSRDDQLGATTGVVTLDGGTLATTGASPVPLDAGRTLELGAAGGALDTPASAGLTLAGPLAGGGALAKQGDGALVLSGNNGSFGGAVTVQAGSLQLQHAQALGPGNALILDAGSRLDVAQSVTLRSLAGDGDAVLADATTLSTGLASSRFDGTLSGGGALRKLGGGTLTLAGANLQRGDTQLQAGSLQLRNSQALPDDGALVMSGGSLLVDASEQLGALSGTGTVVLVNRSVLTLGHAGDGATTTFAGSFSGDGALAKQGPGTLRLTGASSHTGGTSVLAGVLAVQADTALGAPAATLTLDGGSLRTSGAALLALSPQRTVATGAAGGTLSVAAGTTLQLTGPLSGDGSVTKAGAGTLALAGANPGFRGAVHVDGGSLSLQQAQALGAAHAVDLAAGTTLELGVAVRLGPLSGSGAVQFNGFTLATGGADSTFSGTLTGGGGGVLQQLGGGRLTLDAATGFTGSTQVLGGTLALAHADALTGSPVSVAAGATLAVQASSRILSLSQPGGGAGQVLLASGTTLSTGDSADTTFSGPISGAGALRKLGSGRFTLSGSNSHTGGTWVDAGTLQGDSLSLPGNFTLAGALVFDQATNGSFNGRLDGAGSLVKQGSGALQLTGAHLHGGGTQVLAGTLRLAGSQAVPDGGAVSLAAGTTLQVDDTETLARLTGSGLLQLQPGTTLTLGDASSMRFDGTLAGSGGLVKQGSGQLVLAGASGHSGGTLVQGGSLALAAPDVLAASTVTLAGLPGVELRLLRGAHIGALASNDGPAVPAVVLDGFSLSAGANGDSTRFAGSTLGTGSLVKQGDGMLTLAGSNGHTGATQVQGGSLALLGAQALSVASPVQVDAGASLVLQATQTIGALAGAGAVQLGGFQLTTVVPGDSLFSGQISGSGGLVKQGDGRLTLAGSNNFTGAVDLLQGTLALNGGAALDDGVAVRLAAGSRLVAAASEAVAALSGAGAVQIDAGTLTTTSADSAHTLSGNLSGPGRLAKAGSGSLTLSGTNTHTGGLALLGGSLVVADDSALGAIPDAAQPASLLLDGGTLRAAGSFSLAAGRSLVLQGAGGTVQVDAGHTLGLPAALADGSSAGALVKTGAGTLLLTAPTDSSRSGSTLVRAGALALQRDGQLGTAAGALVLDGGTLQVDQTLRLADARALQLGAAGGTLQVATGAALQLGGLVADSAGAGGGTLTKSGAGSLLFDGAADNTHTGATRLLGGSIAIQRDGQFGAAPAVARADQLLIDGATLQIDGDTVLAAQRGLALGPAGATLEAATGRVVGLAGTVADAAGASGGAFVKSGGGLLRLQGTAPSSHTGATQVLAGTLALSADGQLGAAPAARTPGHLVLDGGTLLAEGSFRLDTNRGLQLGAAGGTLDVAAGQQLAYAGVVAGGVAGVLAGSTASPPEGGFTKAGGGRLLLDGAAANTHAGATRLLAGTLAIQRDDQLGAAPATATPGHLLLDGGTLQVGGSTTLAPTRGTALGGQGGVLDVAAGASVVYDGVLADAAGLPAGGIDKTGAGSLVLGGASSHTGATRVLAGTLATSAAQRLPQAGAVQLANGASLVLGGHQTLAALGDAPNPGGAAADATALVDLGAFTLRLDTAADDGRALYSGAFTGSGGQLLKQGGGTLQLAGGGVGRNQVTVDAGLLVSLGGNTLSTEAAVVVAPGAALRLMAPVTVQTLDLAGRLSGPGGLTASTSVDLRSAVVDTTVATATLRSEGSSQINAAVQAGSSTVADGILTLGDGGSLQTTRLALQGGATLVTQGVGQLGGLPAVVADNGHLRLAGAEQVATLTLAGSLSGPGSLAVAQGTVLQGASVLASLQADTLRSTGSNLLQAPVVARSSAMLADGSLTLGAGGSLATPSLTLQAGTLATGSGPALSADSRLVVQRDATLLLGADQRLASLDLAGTLGTAPAPAAPAAASGQQRALADSPATAPPQLVVDGAALLDGANVFSPLVVATLRSTGSTTLAAPVLASGGTTVAGGLLSVAASGLLTTPSVQVQAGGLATGDAQRIQADTQVALAAGTTLQLGGDQVLARLTDLGATGAAPAQVQLGRFTLAAGADGADATFSGRFSGDGTLAKQGAGTWLLRSDQAHGDTRIEAGTLQLGNGGSSGSLGRGAVANQGLLRFERSDAVQITQDIRGSGSLQQAGSGSLTITSPGLTYTGDTIISAGSLRTDAADRLPDDTHLRLAGAASFATGGDDRLGALTAAGAVSLGGSLASTGHQLYGGPVTVTATVTLSAPLARIEALHAGNQWGAQPLSVAKAAPPDGGLHWG